MQQTSFLRWCEQLVFDHQAFDVEVFSAASQLVSKQVATNADELDLEELFDCAFEIAIILSELRVDCETLVAAMLYPFVDSQILSISDIKLHCSSSIAEKVKGVVTLDGVRGLQANQSVGNDSVQIENLRKMLLVMVDDVSVVLIKLAERLYQLRHAKTKPIEERKSIAKEVRDVFAPLANRLGVGQIKWEMEDLALRYLNEDK